MRIDHFLNLSVRERGEISNAPDLNIIQLNSNLPSLRLLPPEIFLQLYGENIIIAMRNGKMTATAYIRKEFLESLFSHFNKSVPRSIIRMYRYTDWFLMDIDSLTTDVIRFYVPGYDLNFDICKDFPFESAIEEMQTEMSEAPYVNVDLLGFYVSMKDESVTEYKYYLAKAPNIIHNYRFKGNGKFKSKHVEIHNFITPDEAIADTDFGHIFNGVDTSNFAINLAERQDVPQRYLIVSTKPEGIELEDTTQDSQGGIIYDTKRKVNVTVESDEPEVESQTDEEANTSIEEANTDVSEV